MFVKNVARHAVISIIWNKNENFLWFFHIFLERKKKRKKNYNNEPIKNNRNKNGWLKFPSWNIFFSFIYLLVFKYGLEHVEKGKRKSSARDISY